MSPVHHPTRLQPGASRLPGSPGPQGLCITGLAHPLKGFLAIKARWVISKPKQRFFIETSALCYSGQAAGSSVANDTPGGHGEGRLLYPQTRVKMGKIAKR